MNKNLNKLLNDCGCGLSEDNKMIVCPKHYVEMKKALDSLPVDKDVIVTK